MNRLLTYLSAAACFAACTVDSLVAAPSGSPASDDAPNRHAKGYSQFIASAPSFTANDIVQCNLNRGFATVNSSRSILSNDGWEIDHDVTGYGSSRLALDVSEFIPPRWRANDAAFSSESGTLTERDALQFSRPAMFASTDAQILSVPEIPLPLGLVPGLVGVGLAAIAHRRSLRRSKMTR